MADSKFDFVQSLHKLVTERKLIIVTTGIAAVLGAIVAINTPKTYNSSVTLAPELANANRMSESIGSLTAMFGIDLNSMSNNNVDAIFPEIYPKVVTSPDFIVELWSIPVTLKDGTVKSYFEHINEDGFLAWWDYPIKWVSDLFAEPEEHETYAPGDSLPDPRYFDTHHEGIYGLMAQNIMCDVSKDNGLITITVSDYDPVVACLIADIVQQKLQQYITRYRTQKARNDYEYAERLVNEAREEYLNAQLAAARFADANISVFKQKVIIERDILQNEFQLKYNTYNALSGQLQNAKALIQAATPVYTTIRKSTIPNHASGTPRLLTMILYAILGFVLSVVWILFGRDYLGELVAQYRAIDQLED